MTIKELSQYRWLVREIELNKQRLAALEESAAGPASPALDPAPHGTGYVDNRVEQKVVAIVTLREMIEAQQAECLQERVRLETYIGSIQDSQTRMIFHYRFVDGYSWIRVAHATGGGNTEDSVKKICYRYLSNN